MRLEQVMTEVAQVVKGISGLNKVFGYPPETLVPPAGYVSYPEVIDYDQTYGRGEDQITDLPIVLVASPVDSPTARDKVSAWSAGAGPKSIKEQLEAHTFASCDQLLVTECRFAVERIGGEQYLVAVFKATVTGAGNED